MLQRRKSWLPTGHKSSTKMKSSKSDNDQSMAGDDPDKDAEVIAELFYGIYGNDALEILQENPDAGDVEGKSWDANLHPRGKGGRFIPRGSSEALATAKEAVSKVIKGEKSVGTAEDVLQHINILTVKQLKQLHKEYGKPIPKGLRYQLIDAIKAKIDPDNFSESGKNPVDNSSSKPDNQISGEKPVKSKERKTVELPKLTGSEKQIAWAEQIRKDALDLTKYHKSLQPEVQAILPVVASAATKHPEAKFWIDNKDGMLSALFASHFGLPVQPGKMPLGYRTIQEAVNYNEFLKSNGKPIKNEIDEDESNDLIKSVGRQKAEEIANSFGFKLS